jgi:hypothetical protein
MADGSMEREGKATGGRVAGSPGIPAEFCRISQPSFLYNLILLTMAAPVFTGHKLMLPDAIWVAVSFFSSFCSLKILVVDYCVQLFSPSLKKQRLKRHRIFVCHFSACATFRYLHDSIVKKIARVMGCPINCCNLVSLYLFVL